LVLVPTSSYEDIARAASIAKQVTDKKLKNKVQVYDYPGSEVVRYMIERDGFIDIFDKMGATVLQMLVDHVLVCGIEKVLKRRTKYNRSPSIVISKRADGNPNTMAFVGSPELVTAI
jgi:aconitate hydratase